MPPKSELAKRRIREVAPVRRGLLGKLVFSGRALVDGSPDDIIPHLPHIRYDREVAPEITPVGQALLRGLVVPIANAFGADSATPGMSLKDVTEAWLKVNKEKKAKPSQITIFDRNGEITN